jgi:hypothetical protein
MQAKTHGGIEFVNSSQGIGCIPLYYGFCFARVAYFVPAPLSKISMAPGYHERFLVVLAGTL